MLPAVSIEKYANVMSLLKANMPIGHKDPAKDVDDGMAGGYSELKEPGWEGEDRHHSEEDERLAQDCPVFFAKTLLVFGFKRRYFLFVQRFQTLVPIQLVAPDPLIPTTCFSFSNFTSSSLISDVGID